MRSRLRSAPQVMLGAMLIGIGLAGGACSGGRSPEAPSATRTGPGGAQPGQDQTSPGLLTVSQVDVIIMESFPPQITAKVDGWLPDGCSEVGDITQQRNGRAIDVTITIRRLTTGACIAIAPQVSRSIRLNGSFSDSGTYTVRVNGVEKAFTL